MNELAMLGLHSLAEWDSERLEELSAIVLFRDAKQESPVSGFGSNNGSEDMEAGASDNEDDEHGKLEWACELRSVALSVWMQGRMGTLTVFRTCLNYELFLFAESNTPGAQADSLPQ
ncbi:hypothetical protein F66182_4231 [Fusarium sp. NRRL 66182]|nr:hypothetical protein F66182_4231 [Fusarium sp. NRRL 66182]